MCVVYFMHAHVYIVCDLCRNRFLIRTHCIVYIKHLADTSKDYYRQPKPKFNDGISLINIILYYNR